MRRLQEGPKMSSNRKRVVTWPVLVAMLASPLLMNCGSLPGAGCKGDFKDPSSIAKLSFGLSADVEGKVKAALEAVANVQALAVSLEADVQTACMGLAKDLGAKDDELKAAGKDTAKLCDLAVKMIGTAKAEAKAAGKLTISAAPPVCGVSVDAAAECAASCDASVKGGSAEVKCEGGEMSGACDAECSGSCDVSAGGACEGTCEGSFSGTCEGDCEGTCDGADAKGKCAGKCEGTCKGTAKGTCKGSCKLAAKAKCSGTCSGSCSVKFKEPKCSGNIVMPKVKAECKGQCDAKLDAKVTCSPPAVKITFSGDAKAGAKLGAALEKNLPLLLKVVKGMAVKATAAVAKVGKAVADVKGALNGQALLKAGGCLVAGLKAQVAASASINVSVKASASASGSASSGLSRAPLSNDRACSVTRWNEKATPSGVAFFFAPAPTSALGGARLPISMDLRRGGCADTSP
jgi:hypothetical protein